MQSYNQLLFIDSSVSQPELLIQHLAKDIKAIFLDPQLDAIDQITATLAQYCQPKLQALHLVTHGRPGQLTFSQGCLSWDTLDRYQDKLISWQSALLDGADILLYGCETGANSSGKQLIEQLAFYTGCNIASSTAKVGHERLSANWVLDQTVGSLSTNIFCSSTTQLQWKHQLADLVISNNDGSAVASSSGNSVGQSFTATKTGEITEIRVASNTAAGDTLKIFSGSGIAGTLEHTQSITFTDTVTDTSNYTLFSITLDTPVAITSGQTYTFAFSGGTEQLLYDNQTYASGDMYVGAGAFGSNDLIFEVVQSDAAPSGPTVTDGNISVTSSGTGSGGAYIVGDTITVRWDAGTDGNTPADISSVNMDLSAFGGGASVSASETSSGSGIWEASFTIVEGSVDATNLNATVTATDINGNTGPVSDTSNLTVDSTSPTVSDGNISISGASGTAGTYKIGDTVTATWDNTGTGDNNSDTISSVTVDFSAFGGGSAVTASNSSGTWTATYTITSGSIDSSNLNVSVTAIDDAGNQTTTADTTNASVDNEAPTSPSISGSLVVDENSANASSVGTVSASGATAFTLTDSANGRFDIDSSGNITVADTSQIDYESNTSHNITVLATDDAGNTSNNTLAVTINNVNEVPTLTATGSDPTFTEDGSAASLFTGASVSTADAGQTISGMVITVTNVADSGNEILNIDGSAITLDNAETGTSNNLGYSVAVNSGTATITLNGGTLSAANVQTLIDSISYQNNSQTPSTSNRVVTITSLTDSGSDNNTASGLSVASTVTVSAVNDAPVIASLDATRSYTEDAAAIQLDADISISDAELDALNDGSGNYADSTLTIVRNGSVDSSDEFSISTGGNLTVSGSDISVGGHVIATFDTTSTAGQVTVSFQNNGTIPTQALVNEVLQAVYYRNTSNDPASSAQLDYSFSDGSDTGTGSVTVTLTNVNDAPTITATGDNLTAAGAGSAVSVFSSTAIDAIESENIASVNFTVSGLTDTGNEKLIIDGSTVDLMTTVSSTNATGGNVAYAITNSSGTATVVITGPSAASAANTVFQTALNGMQYQNTLGSVTTGDRVFTITNVTDVGSGTNSWSDGNITSTIDVVNGDTPTAASNTYSGTEDTTVDLATAGMAATIETNASDALDYITVTGITGGTLALTGSPSTTGAAGTVGMASVGTLSSGDKVSTANIGLIDFTPTTNSTTAASITYTVTDAGGDTSSTATLTINLAAVNDAPTAADATKSVSYNSTYTFQESDFSFSDVDTGDTLDHITIESLPAAGTLTFNGGALTLSDIPAEVTKAELVAGKLTFTPESGGTGNDYASFTFTVNDNTIDSVSANTITMNVGSRPSSSTPTETTTQVDGADQTTTTEQDSQGNTIQVVTVAPVTPDRQDTDSTSTGADVPFQFLNNDPNNVVTTLSLPTGLGARVLSNSTANTQNQATNLINLIQGTGGDSEESQEAQNSVNNFISNSGSNSNIWVNSVTLNGSASSGNSPVLITGSSDTTHREAVVIDTRTVTGGAQVQLDNIEYSFVSGSATITGGAGENYVHGDEASQFIRLGADDDELHGGGGDDTIGSQGGDDLLFGDSGDDIVFGGTGHDTLYGGIGNDVLQGGQSTEGALSFSLNDDGDIVTQFTPTDAGSSDIQTLSFSGDWYSQASMILDGKALGLDLSEDNIAVVMNAGLMLQATSEYAFLAMDTDRLQMIASSYQGIFGELVSATDLTSLAGSNYSTSELASLGVQAWISQQGEAFTALSATEKVSTFLSSIWSAADVTDDAIANLLLELSQGSSLQELFLSTIQSQHAKDKLTIDGLLQLTATSELGETGLSTEIGNDFLYGGDGSDTLIGGHGDDYIDGGEGTDTAVQQHLFAEYAIAQLDDGSITLTYQQGAYTEVDTLVGVEWVQFSDRLISTDDLL